MITPIVRGSSGTRQELLGLEQALGVELLAQPLDPREQVALAGDAQVGDVEGEGRGGGRAAGVVVAAAGDHHLHALGRRPPARASIASQSWRQAAHGIAPVASRSSKYTRARDGRRLTSSPISCTRANAAQPRAQRGRVLADRERAGERAVGDARIARARRCEGSVDMRRSIGATIDVNAAQRPRPCL